MLWEMELVYRTRYTRRVTAQVTYKVHIAWQSVAWAFCCRCTAHSSYRSDQLALVHVFVRRFALLVTQTGSLETATAETGLPWKWYPSHVSILVFLGLSVLEFLLMYATERRQTPDAHHHLMPLPKGGGIINCGHDGMVILCVMAGWQWVCEVHTLWGWRC